MVLTIGSRGLNDTTYICNLKVCTDKRIEKFFLNNINYVMYLTIEKELYLVYAQYRVLFTCPHKAYIRFPKRMTINTNGLTEVNQMPFFSFLDQMFIFRKKK